MASPLVYRVGADGPGPSPAAAALRSAMDNRRVPVDHYENFPVASLLCPPRLRPPVEAIYAFARTADDIADEGDAAPAERLASLDASTLPTWPRSQPAQPPSGALACGVRPARQRPSSAHRLPRRSARRAARRIQAGRDHDALRRPRRAARLLPPLGQSGRPPAASSVRYRRRRCAAALAMPSAPPCSSPTSGRTSAATRARGRVYVPETDCRRARASIRPNCCAGRDSAGGHVRWSPTWSPGRAS